MWLKLIPCHRAPSPISDDIVNIESSSEISLYLLENASNDLGKRIQDHEGLEHVLRIAF